MERHVWSIIIAFYTLASVRHGRTLFWELETPAEEELKFMKRYGYLPDEPNGVGFVYTPRSISEAVKKVQKFAGLPQTGILDKNTKELFRKKRCGVKDITNAPSRKRRYIIQQGWNKRVITYRVLNGSSTLSKDRIESLMSAALDVWAPHAGLHFVALDRGPADIEVSFAKRDHGDGFPFDGPGRVVAHAFPPPHGAMHFDDDELWGDGAGGGSDAGGWSDDEEATDFFAVAVHEAGHALGLSHSSVKASVMYPYYQVPVEKLHMDDILGMQELYLKNERSEDKISEEVQTVQPTDAPRFTKPADYPPDPCLSNYDTLQVIHGEIFLFEEEWLWVYRNRRELEVGFPRKFREMFRELPSHVTAVNAIYENINGHIVIFKDRNYWEFDRRYRMLKSGTLSEYSLPENMPEVTTVFLSNYNNKTYLIHRDEFWRYDESKRGMDEGYPKSMSAWREIPYPVDAAVIWKGDTYFFRGPRFWRFDNDLVKAQEYYPAPTARVWFNCGPSPEMAEYITSDSF